MAGPDEDYRLLRIPDKLLPWQSIFLEIHSMKKCHYLFSTSVLLASMAVGFGLGGLISPHPPAASDSEPLKAGGGQTQASDSSHIRNLFPWAGGGRFSDLIRSATLAAEDPENALDFLAQELPLMQSSLESKAALIEALVKSDQRNLNAILELGQAMQGPQGDHLRKAILLGLGNVAPANAIEFARTEKLESSHELLSIAFTSLATEDSSRAFQEAENLQSLAARETAFTSILPLWLEKDGPEALAAIDRLPDRLLAHQIRGQALHLLATTQPEAAATYALAEKNLKKRQDLLENVASVWCDTNPAALFDFLKDNHSDNDAESLRRMAALHLANYDPAQASAMAAEVNDMGFQIQVATQSGLFLVHENPTKAIEYMQSLSPELRAGVTPGMLLELAKADPARTAQLLPGLGIDTSASAAAYEVASFLSETDPENALEWAESLEVESIVKHCKEAIYRVLATNDPAAALDLAQKENDPGNLRTAMDTVAECWASENCHEFIEWAAAKASESFEGGLQYYGTGIRKLSEIDPQAAAQHYAKLAALSSGDQDSSHNLVKLAGEIGSQFAHPKEAFTWAGGLSESNSRAAALSETAARWVRLAPESFDAEIANLKSSDQDLVRQQAAKEIVTADTHRSLELAAGIRNAEQQASVLSRVYQNALEIEFDIGYETLLQLDGVSEDLARRVHEEAMNNLKQ
jgi:hypothetical protein